MIHRVVGQVKKSDVSTVLVGFWGVVKVTAVHPSPQRLQVAMARLHVWLMGLIAVASVREALPRWAPPASEKHAQLCFGVSCARVLSGHGCVQRSGGLSPLPAAVSAPRRCRLQAEIVGAGGASAVDDAVDDLGVLLQTWGVADARPVLEANGFSSVDRVRDLLEADDLPELGLPLATRKILARLIKHLADEKREETKAAAKEKVKSILLEEGICTADASDDEVKAAVAAAQKIIDVKYNSDARTTRKKWEPFHRAVTEAIATAAGTFELRAIEEVELDAPVNEAALDTSLAPSSDDDGDLPDTVPLSSGRGGRYEAARKRVLAPPPPLQPGQKQKRHFRYRSREGDFFVKVVLTGEPVDQRCADEKEDAAGDMLSMFMGGDLENADTLDFGADLDSLVRGLGSQGATGAQTGSGGSGLILDIPDGFKLQLFGAEEETVKGLKYPQNFYEGEQVALSKLRSTGQMRMPAPMVAGDLLDADFVSNHLSAGLPRSDLMSGGYGVLEWVELQRTINPLVVSDVAQQLARVHLSTEGMSQDYGFGINTFLGEREQDNTISRGVDVLDFLTSRRLEPEIDAASRYSSKRAAKIPAKLRDEIGTKGFKVSSMPHPFCPQFLGGLRCTWQRRALARRRRASTGSDQSHEDGANRGVCRGGVITSPLGE